MTRASIVKFYQFGFIFSISSIPQGVFAESAQKPVKYTQNRLKQTRLLAKNE